MSQFFIKTCLLVSLTTLGIAQPAWGANILLRERAMHHGAVVYLGDIADISAATEAEVHDLTTTPLMAAPAPGAQEFLHAAKVKELLLSRGIDVAVHSFGGAKLVEFGDAVQIADSLVTESVQVLNPKEAREAVIDAIVTHLVQTTGHQDWYVEASLSPAEMRDLCKLGGSLKASAGRTPWTGSQRFEIVGESGAVPALVLAKVDRLRHVVVASRRLEQGSLIGAADVEVRLQGGNVPTTAMKTIDQVLGKEAIRSIDANTIMQESQVRSPLQVQRGETVKVFARTGGITVSTFAVAQQNGALGDLVQAQTLDKKERFAARVSGWKQLEVLPTGATTSDYAALKHPETHKR